MDFVWFDPWTPLPVPRQTLEDTVGKGVPGRSHLGRGAEPIADRGAHDGGRGPELPARERLAPGVHEVAREHEARPELGRPDPSVNPSEL
ncbi:MAG TPA: hypothetical protein VFS40_16015 [Gemmatimonadales bacterium]|nr:hypothetical protein [Gemmatimonadales bacterium]